MPGPEPSVGPEVGAAASAVGSAVADSVAEGEPDAVGLGEGEPLGEVLAEGRADADPPFVLGVDPVFVVDEVDPAVVLAAVGLGADVVFLGADVALGFVVVGAGWLVAVGSGGATRGCCPEPNRKPTTVPGAGLKVAAPLEL